MIEYNMRPYVAGDEDRIVSLLILVFNNWPHFDLNCSPLDHWRWKYMIDTSNFVNIYVAEHNSLIIGNESRLRLRAKVGEKTLVCEQRCDLSVHPDYRGKGIFKKLHSLTNKASQKIGIYFSYAIEGNPIVINYLKKRGVPTFDRIVKNLYWIKNNRMFLEKHNKKNIWVYDLGFKLYKLIYRIKSKLFMHTNGENSWVIKNILKFDDRFDVFWKELSQEYDYILVRDRHYLNWRYCDQRGGTYIIKAAEESSKILGYIVLRINRLQEESPTGHIVDIQALPGYNSVIESLLKESIEFFSSSVSPFFKTLGNTCFFTYLYIVHPHLGNSLITEIITCAPAFLS